MPLFQKFEFRSDSIDQWETKKTVRNLVGDEIREFKRFRRNKS